ncbi:hypothetical protein PIB30_003561 [Stylosanthes scabra]|uniref:HMG box domain-containing protein n=1 Tax=Stylosanthes scabra TaxID=79078 RepID=A0ABU6X493_9FABA|nr:hypothetical protein [Stylosanthes scabra]
MLLSSGNLVLVMQQLFAGIANVIFQLVTPTSESFHLLWQLKLMLQEKRKHSELFEHEQTVKELTRGCFIWLPREVNSVADEAKLVAATPSLRASICVFVRVPGEGSGKCSACHHHTPRLLSYIVTSPSLRPSSLRSRRRRLEARSHPIAVPASVVICRFDWCLPFRPLPTIVRSHQPFSLVLVEARRSPPVTGNVSVSLPSLRFSLTHSQRSLLISFIGITTTETIKKTNPKAEFKEISNMLGAKWKTVSAKEKKPYKDK